MRAQPRKAGAPLGEEQAWNTIEEIFTRRTGVCKAIAGLRERGLISERTAQAMQARVDAAHERPEYADNGVWFLGPFVKDYIGTHDEPRRKFARECRRAALGVKP